jgi:methylaspartate mutase epsilon subunit
MMVVVIQILELLLSAEQGVKSFAVSFGQTGSIDQDIAIAKALRVVAKKFLSLFDFNDIQIKVVYHQWMGAFPIQRIESEALISIGALIASMVNVDKIVTKTYHEAHGVPSIEANTEGIRLVKYIFEHFKSVGNFKSERSIIEEELIISESEYLLNSIFESKASTIWECIFQSVIQGKIDIPFSPHSENSNKLLTIRDKYHAIRIVNPGNVPITQTNLKIEKDLLGQNKKEESLFYKKLLDDIILMV